MATLDKPGIIEREAELRAEGPHYKRSRVMTYAPGRGVGLAPTGCLETTYAEQKVISFVGALLGATRLGAHQTSWDWG